MSTWKRATGVLLITFFVLVFFAGDIKGGVGSCQASVDPSSVAPNSTGSLNFTVTNSESSSIIWVKITSPSGNFTITSGTKSGWSAVVAGSSVTFTGGVQGVNTSTVYQVNVSTAGETAQSAWVVQASDAAGGAGAATCGGGTAVAISGSPADNTAPSVIGNVSITVVDNTSVTLAWTTDEAAISEVEYGTPSEYTDSVTGTSYLTSHSVTLTGLSTNATYHFRIILTDALDNTSWTADNTFTVSPGTTTTNTTTASTTTSTPVKKDTAPPTIALKTDFAKPFKDMPVISGQATDDISVDKVEYSIDGGKNYLPVKITKGTSVNFSFKPQNLEDGNYNLVVRATDSSEKTGTDSDVLIIDKLPPAIGGNNIFLGPQNIFPGLDGTITVVLGSEVTIAVNSVGGPIKTEYKISGKTYPLSQVEGTNIWKGKVKFEDEGEHKMNIVSEDGAGNVTERVINNVKILSSGTVKDLQGEIVENAEVSVFAFSPELGTWVLWDGGVYGQKNPQKMNDGKFGYLIPKGKYYLSVSADGYRSITSDVFVAQGTSVVNSEVIMEPRPSINLLGQKITLPKFLDIGEVASSFPVSLVGQGGSVNTDLVGKKVPDLVIKTTDGSDLKLSDLKGNTVVTFLLLTTWSPASQEQMAVLDRLEERGFDSLPIFMMESEGIVKSFMRRGGYKIRAGIDPEGILLKDFPITSLPQHFVVDEKGVIREVVVGAKSQKEMREILERIQ